MEASTEEVTYLELTSNDRDFVRVCSVIELPRGNRKRLGIDKRDITLFHSHKGTITAIDSVCYRTDLLQYNSKTNNRVDMGGPLDDGDIEGS